MLRVEVSILPAVCLLLAAPVLAQNYPSPADLTRALSVLQKGMEITATTIDGQGNVYLAGVSSSGFAGATVTIGPRGNGDMFVIKLNPAADQVIYATSIGGSQEESVRTIRADASGNLFLIGTTTSFNFPTTTQFTPMAPTGGIALKLNAAGTTLIYSTGLGYRVEPLALDIDGTGTAVIAGHANSQDLPFTPGVIDPSPAEGAGINDYSAFIAKLTPDGTALSLATYYGPKGQWIESLSIRPNGNIYAMSFGSLVAFDSALSRTLFVTAVDLLPASMSFDQSGSVYLIGNPSTGGVFLKRLSADGQTTLLNLQLPLVADNPAPRMVVTATGRIYIFGEPTSLVGKPNPPAFPTLNASQTCLANIAPPDGTAGLPGGGSLVDNSNGFPPAVEQALMVLEPDGTLLHSTFFAPRVPAASYSSVNGRIYAGAIRTEFTNPGTAWLGLIRFDPSLVPVNEVAPSCLVHSATFATVPVSPGTIMAIYGSNLGPGSFLGDYTEGAFVTALDQNGKFPFLLGGTSVTVDGRPAALYFTWTKQINFVVPWATRTDGALVPVCVTRNNVTKCLQAATTAAVPAAFDRGLVSAVLNQDFSVNEVSHPAARGSAVQIFMTGGGLVGVTMVDGGVTSGNPLQHTLATVTATASPTVPGGCSFFSCDVVTGSGNVEVLFAGAAPQLIMGALQVNIRIPSDMPVGVQVFAINFQVPGAPRPVVALVKVSIN